MANNANNSTPKANAVFTAEELAIASYLGTTYTPSTQYCGLDLPIGEKVTVPLRDITVPDVSFLLEADTLKTLSNPAKAARSNEGTAILRKAIALSNERLELHFGSEDPEVFYTMYPTWSTKNILRTKNGGDMFFAVRELFQGFNACYSMSSDSLKGNPAHVFLRVAQEMDRLIGKDLTALGVVSEKTGYVNYHYSPAWIKWYLEKNHDESDTSIILK